MSISSRITEMEQHIGNAYDKIEDLGIDLTNVDKNINNISSMLEDVWDEYPKVTATDVEEATINGTKKGRMEIDLKGQTSQSVLPTEYQQVEYIENTGSSYIDTGKILTQNNSFEFKMKSPEVLGSETSMNCGSRSGASFNNISSNFQGNNLTVDFNNSNYTWYRASYSMQPSTIYKVYSSKLIRKISDENDNVLASNTNVCNDTIRTPNTCTIFKINPAPQTYWLYARTKLYYFKIWENDELVMNLVPCYRKADNEIGMYDTITNTFLTNQGTDIFVKGNDVPNPDFTQQIKNVTGNANVKIQNKNWFDKDNATTVVGYFSADGSINYGGSSTITTSYSEIKPNTDMIVSGCPIEAICFYDKNKNFIERSFISANVSFNKNAYFIRLQAPTNTFDINKLQIEEGTTATAYVPHQEQNYPFTFAEGQRAMQGTELKDDGIRNKHKQKIFDGTEYWLVDGDNMYITLEDAKGYNTPAVCNYFIYTEVTNNNYGYFKFANSSKNLIFFKAYAEKGSIAKWKEYLAEQYANGTPVIVEYDLEEEEIIPYNSTQQAQYNAIKQARSYDDITYITSTSDELGFNMKAIAIADANKVINAIKQARSYDDITYITSTSDELGFNMKAIAIADANKVIDNQNNEIDTIKSRLDLLEG